MLVSYRNKTPPHCSTPEYLENFPNSVDMDNYSEIHLNKINSSFLHFPEFIPSPKTTVLRSDTTPLTPPELLHHPGSAYRI